MSEETFFEENLPTGGPRRDWRTPVAWHGRPETKTYWDWAYHLWRTEVCILVGVRDEPASTPWSERRANAGLGRQPDRPRADFSPRAEEPGTLPGVQARPGSLCAQIRNFLRQHGPATSSAVVDAVQWPNRRSVSAMLYKDPLIVIVSGRQGSGRPVPGEEARFALRELSERKDNC